MREMSDTVLRLNPIWSGWPSSPLSRLTIYWMVFAVSVSAFVTEFLLDGRLPAFSATLHFVGLVPCGFAWLFARTLFRQRRKSEYWPELVVAVLFASCVILHFDRSGDSSGLLGYVALMQGLIGTAMLIMTLVEALDGTYRASRKERRFRMAFAGSHLTLVAVSFVFALPEFAGGQTTAHVVLASCALMGSGLALRYRQRHPLPRMRAEHSKVKKDPVLAASIQRLLREEDVYLDPGIKVADLASRLNVPDYRVSQCIVNDLNYANFNRLVNAYRLEAAKRRLSQRAYATQSILVIAMDCGFGSLGPFNRAFRAQTGMTPTAYRKEALERVADQ